MQLLSDPPVPSDPTALRLPHLVAVGNQVALPSASVIPASERSSAGSLAGETPPAVTGHRAHLGDSQRSVRQSVRQTDRETLNGSRRTTGAQTDRKSTNGGSPRALQNRP